MFSKELLQVILDKVI